MAHRLLAWLATFAAVAQAGPALADVDVTLDQLPAPVRATVDRETQGGTIQEIERETERGQKVYEIEYVLDGVEYEIDVAPDGTLLGRHQD